MNKPENKSMMDKVRRPKLRPPEATPKEKDAWNSFMEMAQTLQEDGKGLSPLLKSELERLAAKGNPLAIRMKERISISEFKPREADAAPTPPPPARRISALKFGRPTTGKQAQK